MDKKERQQEGKNKEFFYFDLTDPSHKKLQEKELDDDRDNPLEPLTHVTEVEY